MSDQAIEQAFLFREFVKEITAPPSTGIERTVGSLTGLHITLLTPDDPRQLPQEIAEHVIIETVPPLAFAPVTLPFKEYVYRLISQSTQSALMRMVGADYILEVCGLQDEGLGMFDLEQASMVERNALDGLLSSYIPMDRRQYIQNEQLVSRWLIAYQQVYGVDLTQDDALRPLLALFSYQAGSVGADDLTDDSFLF